MDSPRQMLKLMTFNLRNGDADDDDDGARSWRARRRRVADVLDRHRPAVLGVQEALSYQVDFVAEALTSSSSSSSDYARLCRWFGKTGDGTEAGERTAVFYDARRLDAEASGDFWLSQTPDVAGSKAWDSALPRVATWARFRARDDDGWSRKSFYFFNTHLDHVGEEARLRGAELILNKMDEIVGKQGSTRDATPVGAFLVGDFNCTRKDPPWRLLTGRTEVDGKRGSLVDVWKTFHGDGEGVNQPSVTWHDYKGREFGNKDGQRVGDWSDEHIDFIFYRPSSSSSPSPSSSWNDEVKVHDVEVVADGDDDGRFPSDHFPVVATISLL